VIVALLASEIHSEAADRWIRIQQFENLTTSTWTLTEVGSALARKYRDGDLNQTSYDRAVSQSKFLLAGLQPMTIREREFRLAGTKMVVAPPRGLRAGDALHLAVVVERGCELATLDRRFAEAASAIGVSVTPIIAF
jgi:predicted nucleic acid-binding protein